jgi:Rhamnan synthesis protein F
MKNLQYPITQSLDDELMSVMNRWKIKHESIRIWQQLISIPAIFTEYIAQRKYDKNIDQSLSIHDGTDQNSQRYAIVLSFQPTGLSTSSLYTCKHIHDKGFKVLLVSNVALVQEDVRKLARCTWKIMLRSNFGYDFGGYRDGIRWLKKQGIDPEELLLLNDSTWYPLYANDRLLTHIESSEADFMAAMQLHKSGRPEKKIYESYFYAFSRDLLQSPLFNRFWDKYLLSNIKYRAINGGEKKFSQIMQSPSVRHRGIFNCTDFLSMIRQQNNAFLLKTLEYGAYVDRHFLADSIRLRESFVDTPDWHRTAFEHICAVAQRRHFHASFCFATISLQGIPFLKKSFTPLHVAMRRQFCDAVLKGDLPPLSCPEMFEEIVARDSKP